ncbi:HutD family protein [Melaminivora sp.]
MTGLQLFDLARIPPTPWKNGGGATRELACWPPGSGLQDFGWRVSVASVTQAGPFSCFPGIDRQIMLLQGAGMLLRGPGLEHRLEQPWQPFAFAGELRLDCQLLGAACQDFNLMLRRDQWQGQIELIQSARPLGGAMGLCLVLAGTWALQLPAQEGDEATLAALPAISLSPGQGLRWQQAQPGRLLPLKGAEPPMLAWVELKPAHHLERAAVSSISGV